MIKRNREFRNLGYKNSRFSQDLYPNYLPEQPLDIGTRDLIVSILSDLYEEKFIESASSSVFIDYIDARGNLISILNPMLETTASFDRSEFGTTDFKPYKCGRFIDRLLSSSIWKAKIEKGKNVPTLYSYKKDRLKPNSSKKKIPTGYLIDFFMCMYGLNAEESIYLSKAINSTVVKSNEGIRYTKDLNGSFHQLHEKLQDYFFIKNEYIATENNYNDAVSYGAKLKDNEEIILNIFTYLLSLEYIPTKGNKNLHLSINLTDYKKMDNLTQLKLLNQIIFINNDFIYLKMDTTKDVMNSGRQYNTLTNIPKNDRQKISNLYGVDISTCLQSIIVSKFDDLELPFTKMYIENRNKVRNDISKTMGWEISVTKMEITSIYQGRKYIKSKYESLKHIFDERDIIQNAIIGLRSTKGEAIKYASHRTNKKLLKSNIKDYTLKDYEKLNNKQEKIKRTFMYFYWTFFEREIQNVIASNFKYPKTLHDAVYTQNREEFDALDLTKIESDILSKTGIKIKLEID